jgi:hypothetical protein
MLLDWSHENGCAGADIELPGGEVDRPIDVFAAGGRFVGPEIARCSRR